MIDDNGNIVYNAFYPFGVAASNPYSLQYCVVEDNSDNTKYFDGLEIFDNARNVGIIKHGTPSQVFFSPTSMKKKGHNQIWNIYRNILSLRCKI